MNIQIHARLPAQEITLQMFKSIIYLQIYNLISESLVMHRKHPNYFDGGKEADFVFSKLSNFDYSVATLKWQIGTKQNVIFWFVLIVTFLFKYHTENFKTVNEFIRI